MTLVRYVQLFDPKRRFFATQEWYNPLIRSFAHLFFRPSVLPPIRSFVQPFFHPSVIRASVLSPSDSFMPAYRRCFKFRQ